jgi:hypothetical protein
MVPIECISLSHKLKGTIYIFCHMENILIPSLKITKPHQIVAPTQRLGSEHLRASKEASKVWFMSSSPSEHIWTWDKFL